MIVTKALSYLQVSITSYCIDEGNSEVFLALDKDMLGIKLLRDCFKLGQELTINTLSPHLHLMSKISSKGLVIFINFP